MVQISPVNNLLYNTFSAAHDGFIYITSPHTGVYCRTSCVHHFSEIIEYVASLAKLVACLTMGLYHEDISVSLAMFEGCFILYFPSLPFENIWPTMHTSMAVNGNVLYTRTRRYTRTHIRVHARTHAHAERERQTERERERERERETERETAFASNQYISLKIFV